MVYRIVFLVLSVWLCSMGNVHGKSGNITGKVLDENGMALATANVVILKEDGKTLVKADYTNDNGVFILDEIAEGKYVLKVTMFGYETYSNDKFEINSSSTTLPDIKLKAKNTQLKEVAVRAQKPFIEVKADRLVVNVDNSIVSVGSSALEMLSRSPGVRVDQNDNISLKGKQGVNVMIDGKITPMSGSDLANMLKSMPANSIDKIEIISNPGAKYDAAGTAGIINIKTKRDQRTGLNGSANIAYGQGVYPKLNAGLNLTYRNKKFSAYLNANYAYRIWFNHLMLDRRFYDSTGALESAYIQDNYTVYNFKNPIASAGADYALSRKTTVGVGVTYATNTFEPTPNNNSRATGPDKELLYYFSTTGTRDAKYYNYSTNANLRHSFDSTGKELTVDIDYAAFGTKNNQSFITQYANANHEEYLPPYYLKSNLDGKTQVRSVKADYTHPLASGAKFETGIKSSYVTADNNPLFYEKISGEYLLDSNRSNHFLYNENINAAYVNANKDWDQWSAQFGLRAEQTVAEWEQRTTAQKYDTSYIQLFPSLAVQRHVDKNNDVGITVSRRIQRPIYQQLNPFKVFIDKTTYQEGYPYLKPALSYTIDLSHTYKQRLITTFTYSITQNPITQVIQPSENDTGKVTVQTDKNLDRMSFYGVGGSYTIPITKWWNNTTNFNAYYARYEGFIANTNLDDGGPTFDINTNNAFILPRNFSAELGWFYNASQVYGFMHVKPTWMLNAGIQKNLFKKTATVKLNVQDFFWTGYPRATSTYKGYQEDFVAERETRQVTLAFIYRFGKRTVAPARRRMGGAEEEKRRANNG